MKRILIILMSLFMTNAIADENWVSFVSKAHNYLTERQAILMSEYKLGDHERFDWDQEKGELVFSNSGVNAVIAKVQFVGSISTKSNTWLWSWANSSISENVKDQIETVKVYGELHKLGALIADKWEADEVDGWEMTSITAKLLGAKGAYRTSSRNGFTYMVIMEINWAN